MIDIKHLTKKYGDNVAVNSISIKIEENEVVGLLGPNGAGKTTTMNILTGFISATSGTVMVGGADILQDPIRAKKQIGYLPEIPPLYKDMTVWEYLSFVYGLKKCKLNEKAHISSICERVGIAHVTHRLIGNLSKGYQQRVGIAQALVGNPPILILDEPTVGLDPAQIVEIRDLIKELGKEHTVILSTHILSEAQLICDRIVMMYKGEVIADDLAENLTRGSMDRANLRAEILGEPEAVLPLLQSVEGVERVRRNDQGEYLIYSASDMDVRPAIFYALANARLPLVGLQEDRISLEQAFIEIMMQNAAPEVREEKNG